MNWMMNNMKSLNEYTLEKTGMDINTYEFCDNMKHYFSFESCVATEQGIKFNDVTLNENIEVAGSDSLVSGTQFKSLEIRKNGWINCESEDSSFIVMNHSLKEAFVIPSMFPVGQPNTEHGYEKFPNINAVQMGAMAELQKLISVVKKLSIEDANYLKSIMGPSLEEKILRTIIDATLFDTPPANGLQNGI